MKLFTIGDSLAQGFRSGAAARTDQCFSTLTARALGVPAAAYSYPRWPHHGLPVDLEAVMRRLLTDYGRDISGLEWLGVLGSVNALLESSEAFYERGEGKETVPYPGASFFHNVAVRGFTAADAWLVTPQLCLDAIANAAGRGDGFLQGPNAPFFRTALKVLNPALENRRMNMSQLDWLAEHAQGEGVENLVLWLGPNNALETVVRLSIKLTPNVPERRPHTLSFAERAAQHWTLWHPADFAAEYAELLRRVHTIQKTNASPDWRVFIATVPLVTIAPVAKGVGEKTNVNGDVYFKYYTYFPFDEQHAMETPQRLTMQQAMFIDDCIRSYNAHIKRMVADLNRTLDRQRYFIVDLADALDQMAWKRNDGNPSYQFPAHFRHLYPPVNTKYYHADQLGRLTQGGLFSLDGVHPTAIGHGLIAWEFLKVMETAGVAVDADKALDWPAICASDDLYSQPIALMHEIYDHQDLAALLLRFLAP